MKKIKFITPILVGASVLASSTAVLTGCEWGQDQNILTMTGGQHILNGVVGVPDTCLQPWVVQFNGKTIKPDVLEPVYFEIQPITEIPKGLEIDVIPSSAKEGEETTYKIWWDASGLSESKAGSYKFNVIAKYRWEGIRYYASTGCITLNIIKRENPTLTYPQGEDAIARIQNKDKKIIIHAPRNSAVAVLGGFQYVGGVSSNQFEIEVDTHKQNFGKYHFEFREDRSTTYLWPTYNLIFWSDKLEWETKDHTITVSIKDTATGRYILRNVDFTLRASYEVDSWENVITQANQGLDHLKDYYHLDSFIVDPNVEFDPNKFYNLERVVEVDGIAHRVRVIGENHDFTNAEHTKTAALTFEFSNILTNREGNPITLYWNETATEPKFNIWDNGSQSCDLKQTLNSYSSLGFMRSLPDALQAPNAIKTVYKTTSKGNKDATLVESKQQMWLLSASEIGAGTHVTDFTPEGEGTCYQYYKNIDTIMGSARRVKTLLSGGAYGYWLRSPYCGKTSGAQTNDQAVTIEVDELEYPFQVGSIYANYVYNSDYGIAPCFCI